MFANSWDVLDARNGRGLVSGLWLLTLGCGSPTELDSTSMADAATDTSESSGDGDGDTNGDGDGDTNGDGDGDTNGDGDGDTNGDGDGDGDGEEIVDYWDVYPLDATFPEGGTFDPLEQLFYVGTLEGGDIHSIDPRTGVNSLLFSEPSPGTWITLGMAVDSPARRLWVCAADTSEDPYRGELWMFDLETGTREEVVTLSHDGENAWCEDVAVAADGTAYATDRENPNIYRIGASFVAELFASDPALGSFLIGQNGIVVLPGDEALIAAVHLPAALNYVSLADGTVTPIEMDGDFIDAGVGSGADGMVLVDDELFVVFDGELARVSPTLADWSSAFSTAIELPRGLTDVVETPGGLYLLNGQAIRFAFGQEPNGPFELVRVEQLP